MKRLIAVALLLLVAAAASAQDPDPTRFVPGLIKNVLLDPTTYVPAVTEWKAMRLDWASSQVFFRNGSVEQNPRFTLSGFSNDTAIGYSEGNRQILNDAVATLELSLVNNASTRAMEGLLLPRYPTHRKIIRTIGWIERSVLASYWTYRQSAAHFRQWQYNERQAQQLGYR
jgi:hypothetical protein